MKNPELAPRTDHGYTLYKAATGDMLDAAYTIADIGAGNSDFADKANALGHNVMRFDAQYIDNPPKGNANFMVADARHLDTVSNEVFDAVVSVLMMQHIEHGNGDVASAIEEMLRITKTPSVDNDTSAGTILIYPVWNREKLDRIIKKDFASHASIGYADDPEVFDRLPEEYRHPTLLIRKTTGLTQAMIDHLCDSIESSKALDKPRTSADIARRAIMRLTGNTERSISR